MDIELVNEELCNGCQTCRLVCSKKAITMHINEEGFAYPFINEEICIGCKKCLKKCPVLNYADDTIHINKALISKSKNMQVRMRSSSGGVFTHLAEYIINKGGVVVGAAFSNDFHSVHHVIITASDNLNLLRGSKYLQSDVGDIYELVEAELKKGRFVLFSGTGCQIAGLRSYLGEEYENLYLLDVVCHGVPSPILWSKYLQMLEQKFKKKVIDVNFRSKKAFHNNRRIIGNNSCNAYYRLLGTEPYLTIFQKNLSLRKSCFNCKFKSISGISDLSLGDLWGAGTIDPSFNDDKGISFVLIHSKKGNNLINAISEMIEFKEVDLDLAVAHNRNIKYPSIAPDNRSVFYSDLMTMEFKKVIKKYSSLPLKIRIKRSIKSLGANHVIHIKNVFFGKKTYNGEDLNLQYGLYIKFVK